MNQSSEKRTATIDALGARQFDVDMVKVSERHSDKPSFAFQEMLPSDKHPNVAGIALMNGSEGGGTFVPAAFRLDQQGDLSWCVNAGPDTADTSADRSYEVALVLVRQDGTVQQLGVDEQEGVVRDLRAADELYMLPNALAETMKENDAFKKNGFELIANDESVPADVVRVSFDEAITYDESATDSVSKKEAFIAKRQNERRIRQQRRKQEEGQRQTTVGTNTENAPQPSEPLADTDTSSSPSPKGVGTVDAATPDTSSDGLSGTETKADPIDTDTTASVVERFKDSEETQAEIDEARGFSITNKRKYSRKQLLNTPVGTVVSGNFDRPIGPDYLKTEPQGNFDQPIGPDYTTPQGTFDQPLGPQTHEQQIASPESAPAVPAKGEHADPAIELADKKLATLRDQLAEASAKRQGHVFGKGQKYEQLQAEYNTQLIALGKMKLSDVNNDTELTDSLKNVAAISYIFDEQAKLREQTKENLKNTKVGKFISWFNTGTKKQRFAKGVLLGGAGVVAGVTAGAVVGVAAGAGLTGAAAATAVSGTRFARYFAKKDNQQGRGMEQLDPDMFASHKLEAIQQLEKDQEGGKLETAASYATSIFERDTKEQQEKRRKSVRAGVAGVAIGAVLGGTITAAIGEMNDSLGEYSNRNLPNGTVEAQPPQETDGNGVVDNESNNDTSGSDNEGTNETPTHGEEDTNSTPDISSPEQSPEAATPDYDFGADASTVVAGEGWYQTFGEMDIPNHERAELLQKVGPALQERGWAYPMLDGTWGISRPGALPQDVLELIQNSR
ncbi:MAG TPA: hypothetical protein VFM68_01310 [Candidatus Saccharimonadales bacterium]|nr:hypothetical protein [Candidatus Saccharimonadales bacterium]